MPLLGDPLLPPPVALARAGPAPAASRRLATLLILGALPAMGPLSVDMPWFVGCAGAAGLGMTAMFSYIAGSPFVLENVYGLSPQAFSAVFAANALGIMAAGAANRAAVSRAGPRAMLAGGPAAGAAGGVAVLAAVTLHLGLAPLLASLFVVVASVGLITPNATAPALSGSAAEAGTGSGLIGLGQFGFGAVAAPLAGIGGSRDALPMAVLIACCAAAGLTLFLTLGRRAPAPR